MEKDRYDKNLKASDNEKSSANYLQSIIIAIFFAIIAFPLFFHMNIQKFKKPPVQNDVQADFRPFMSDFQKKIKSNWNPPRNDVSKTVILLITLDKNGHVVKNVVKESSGDEDMDNAAIEAVENSEPFDNFPSNYRENTVDIEFTFDYNVFNAKH